MLATVQHAQTPFEVSEGANKNVSTIRNEKENNEHIVQSYAQFSSFNADLDLFHAIALHCVCMCVCVCSVLAFSCLFFRLCYFHDYCYYLYFIVITRIAFIMIIHFEFVSCLL